MYNTVKNVATDLFDIHTYVSSILQQAANTDKEWCGRFVCAIAILSTKRLFRTDQTKT